MEGHSRPEREEHRYAQLDGLGACYLVREETPPQQHFNRVLQIEASTRETKKSRGFCIKAGEDRQDRKIGEDRGESAENRSAEDEDEQLAKLIWHKLKGYKMDYLKITKRQRDERNKETKIEDETRCLENERQSKGPERTNITRREDTKVQNEENEFQEEGEDLGLNKLFNENRNCPVMQKNTTCNAEPDLLTENLTLKFWAKKCCELPAEDLYKLGRSTCWWRMEKQLRYPNNLVEGPEHAATTLGKGGDVWMVMVRMGGARIRALLDSGASRSFIVPSLIDQLCVSTTQLDEGVRFRVASGADLFVMSVAKAVTFEIGALRTQADLLVAQVPYQMILGSDWLRQERVVWDFGRRTLTAQARPGRPAVPIFILPADGAASNQQGRQETTNNHDAEQAAEARRLMEEDVERLGSEEAKALVRPAPKRYKNYRKRGKLVPIKKLLKELRQRKQSEVENSDGNLEMCLRLVPSTDQPVQQPGVKDQLVVTIEDESIPLEEGNTKLYRQEQAEGNLLGLISSADEPTYDKFEEWVSGEGQRCPSVIRKVICGYRELFRDKLPPGLPPERVVNHTITLLPGKLPSKGAVYRLAHAELEAQREILSQLKAAKWITLTSSPFAAPSMIVSKKDDASGKQQFRMVINYQELNSMTISPEYPLPTIQDILDMLHGAKIFTIMDMEQGFHQIRMDPHDQYKTAFRTCMGQYEFKVMPFGLRGAPGTFQAVMNHMFFNYIGRGVIAYLDDLLVYSPDVESHAKLLERVLQILHNNKMYPKISKCHFGCDSIEYLGYRVSSSGITPSPEKVEAIRIWPEILQNDTQVKQFLGTVNYCRMFMGPAFADIARPLVELTKKETPFEWKDKHTAAVKTLKNLLINYVTLQVPDPSKPYVLRTDASGYAVGGVLEQDGKPLGYLSKKMSEAEQRYAIYDQELLALIRALEKWRRLLLVAPVTAYTDHRALQYLLKLKADKPLRGRVARWLDFLADFQQLRIEYLPGASNLVADALSRCPLFEPKETKGTPQDKNFCISANMKNEDKINTLLNVDNQGKSEKQNSSSANVLDRPQYAREVVPFQQHSTLPNWKMRIGGPQWVEAYKTCQDFNAVFRKCNKLPGSVVHAELHGRMHDFKFANGLLFVRLQGLWRICVPNDNLCRQYVMYQMHDHPLSGHMGVNKTYDALSRQFYWPGIRAYSRTYVESCPRCRAGKSVSCKPGGLLQSLQIPNRRWSHVSLDFVVGLPRTKQQHDAILTLVDTVSKMAHFIPTTNTVSAEGVVTLLADRLVRYHGLPSVLISDRDPRFVAELWRLFCSRFQIKRALSSSWHPQTDGQTERVHRTLEQVLRTYIQSDESAWEDLLPAVELAYNCTTHNSTGLSPFEVMIGENPLRACDLDVVETLEPTITPPMTKLFQQLVDRAAAHIRQAQLVQQHYANEHRREIQFQAGDKVWVSTKYMQPRGSSKFQARFIGPFTIISKVGKVAYKLELPPSMQIHPVFHVSLLQRDKPRPAEMMQTPGWEPVEIGAPDEDPEFEVEHLLDSRGSGKNEEFLVKWKGFPEESATWEPVRNLTGCKDLLRAFRATRTRQRRKKMQDSH